MKTLLSLAAGIMVNSPASFAAENLSIIPFELGPQQFNGGDSVVIEQVTASSPRLAVGDKVTVHGRYILRSQDRAQLCLYLTTSENVGAEAIVPTQKTDLKKGPGTFELSEVIQHPGQLHLSLYPIQAGHRFGTVYFGTAEQMKQIRTIKLDD